MRLPVIRHIGKFIEKNDDKSITDTLEVLEYITEARGLKEEELDVIGELISNLYGALEVQELIKQGIAQKDALNTFMKRVTNIG